MSKTSRSVLPKRLSRGGRIVTKLEELKAAYEATAQGERYSTGVVVCVQAEGGMDYLLRGCHADGIKNDPEVQFAAIAHNLMSTLLEAVELLETVSSARACQDHEFDVDAWFKQVRSLLEKLK